jgi:hypothetical protein
MKMIWVQDKPEYFRKTDWTGEITLILIGKFAFASAAFARQNDTCPAMPGCFSRMRHAEIESSAPAKTSATQPR